MTKICLMVKCPFGHKPMYFATRPDDINEDFAYSTQKHPPTDRYPQGYWTEKRIRISIEEHLIMHHSKEEIAKLLSEKLVFDKKWN